MAAETQGTGAGYELREYLSRRARASLAIVCNGSGNGRAELLPVPAGYVWHIRRMAVIDGSGAGFVNIYSGSVGPDQLIDSLEAAPPVAWDSESYAVGEVQLLPGESLIATAGGAGANAVVTVAIRYDVLETARVPVAQLKPATCAVCGGEPGYSHQHDGPESADAPDAQDLYDRDPLEHGGVGSLRRDAGPRDGGILPILPSDPSTAAGSDLF